MKRIGLLCAIMILAIGCSQNTVVENESGGESASSNATEIMAKGAGETTTPVTADGDANETLSPQARLAELRDGAASPSEFFAFAKENGDNELGFEALTLLGRRPSLKADEKSQLLDMMQNNYLLSEDASNSQVSTAARMLMSMGGSGHKDAVSDFVVNRFVDGKESLDSSASRMLGMVMQQGSHAAKQKVGNQIVEQFADDDGIVGFVQQLSRGIPSGTTVSFLKSLIEKSSLDSVKGNAMVTLAQLYGSVSDAKGYLKDDGFKAAFPKETIEFISEFDPEEYSGEIEMLLTKVKDDYGDVKTRRGTLGEMAENELFVIQHLSIGSTAPDIVGEDLDGEEFKLSDYRGKVVMLDFWGDW